MEDDEMGHGISSNAPFLEGVGEYSMLPVLQRLGVVYDF